MSIQKPQAARETLCEKHDSPLERKALGYIQEYVLLMLLTQTSPAPSLRPSCKD